MVYLVEVDYERTIENGVIAAGYEWVDNGISSTHFPPQRKGCHNIILEIITFGEFMLTQNVLQRIFNMEKQPAEIRELIAFSEQFEVKFQNPIIALGSVWKIAPGQCLVPYIYQGIKSHCLHLILSEGGWDKRCEFAVVNRLNHCLMTSL